MDKGLTSTRSGLVRLRYTNNWRERYLLEIEMRYFKILILVCIAFIFVGCSTYSNNHYFLMPEPNKSEFQFLSNTLKVTIEPILKRHGLKDSRSNKTPDNVLLYYSSGGNSALRVGVRLHEKMVVLDSFQYHSGSGDSSEYAQLRDELVNAVKEMDGVEVVEIDGPSI